MLDLEKYLQEIESAKILATDTETVSLQDKTLVGFSYAYLVKGKVKRYYIPVKHNKIKNMPQSGWKKLLRAIANHPIVVFHNFAFDSQVLFKLGYKMKYIPHDSMIIAHLLDENNSVGLKKLVKRLLKHDMLTFKEICGTGKKQISFANVVDPVIIERYASSDSEYTLKVFLKLYHELQKDKQLFILYEALERPLLPVVASMHNHGITVDVKKVKEIKKHCEEFQKTYKELLNKRTQNINLNSSKQLREYFIDKLNMPVIKRSRKTDAPSVDSEVLKVYSTKCRDAEYILKYRYYSKLLSTFIPALTPQIHQNSTKSGKWGGKIFPSFNQAATTSGRFSSSNPNMQNIPLEDKLGIRECIIAEPGHVLIGADFSQQELRLAAHFSQDPTMITAFKEGKNMHTITAKAVNCSKKQSKVINFSILYGVGAKTLAKNLDTSVEKAMEYIEKYYDTYPKVREFIINARQKAYEQGYLQTFMGRKRHINSKFDYLDEYQKGAELRSMVNAVIQGSGADLLKASMVMIHKEIQKYKACIISTVHDELILSCPKEHAEQVKKIVEKCMVNSGIGLRVPMKVEVKSGKSWGEVH